MLNLKNIVVAYDGSERGKRALKTAGALLKINEGSKLEIVHVINTSAIISVRSSSKLYNMVIHEMRDQSNDILEEAKGVLDISLDRFSTLTLEGSPGPRIVEYATENNTDMIIMGCNGLTGIKNLILGSVSHYVTHHAPCQVLIIK